MTRLSERAVLAALHVGSWTGTLHDRAVTEEVSEKHHADSKDSGRYTKQIISKKALHHVNSTIGVARRTHKLLTLPWDDMGTRILSNRGYIGYTNQMSLKRQAVEAAAHEFCMGMDSHIAEAKTRLGSMFNLEDYPSSENVRNRFYIDCEIKPVSEAGDFRAELSAESTKAIVADIEARTEARLQAAVNDVFERTIKVVGHMAERLRIYKPAENGGRVENGFNDSLVWNIKELADLLPSLNITNDPRLDALQQRLMDDLVEHSPDILKDNDRIRAKTADRAEAILKKVRGFLA